MRFLPLPESAEQPQEKPRVVQEPAAFSDGAAFGRPFLLFRCSLCLCGPLLTSFSTFLIFAFAMLLALKKLRTRKNLYPQKSNRGPPFFLFWITQPLIQRSVLPGVCVLRTIVATASRSAARG
jgi:hypothetical protein